MIQKSITTRKHVLSSLGGLIFLIATLWLISVVQWLRPYYVKAESYDLKTLDDFNVTTIFYDRHGEDIGHLFVEDRTLLKHDEIPEQMRHAAVAIEDRHFYKHGGIDYRGLLRAIYVDAKTLRRSQGASTITQQLAKHVIGRFEKTLERKLEEAFLARRIEKAYTKDQILDYYLNRIYFGKGHFGLASAAKGYFGKEAKDLTLSECATLAGIIRAPNSASPRKSLETAKRRRDIVINVMAQQNLITPTEAAQALLAPLTLAPETPLREQSYYMAQSIKELRDALDLDEGEEIPQGLSVQTTIDIGMQRAAEAEVMNKLTEIDEKLLLQRAASSTTGNQLQVAAVALDASDGAVRVFIGGRDYKESPFDRVRMARRENGALLQPFLYALAFEQLKLHPASMINASASDGGEKGGEEEIGLGTPEQNAGKRFLMIQDALALSNKACATRVGVQLGIDHFVDWLTSGGVKPPHRLGSETSWGLGPLTLYEVVSLYQMLDNGGLRSPPYVIDTVKSRHGELMYKAAKEPGTSLLDPIVAQQMTLTLQSVIRDGTGSQLTQNYSFPAPVVGMTGYSEGYRDAWFVGYTPSLVAGVWVGYDKSMPIGSKALATQTALPVWGNMVRKIIQNEPQGESFPIPESLNKVEVDRRSGVIKGLGFLTPGPGNLFVYLTQDQLNEAQTENRTSQVEQPADWSNWLSTMYGSSSGDNSALIAAQEQADGGVKEIPAVAEYRMPPLRGSIYSADGKVFAGMAQSQNLVLGWPAPEVAHTDDEVVAWIRKRLALAQNWLHGSMDISDLDLKSLYKFQRFHPILVAQNLTPEQVAEFPKLTLGAEGFSLEGTPRRVYPMGDSLAHVLGFLQRTQGRNRKQYQAGEVIYDDYQGAAGLEQYFDKDLRGKEGRLTIATTPEGFAKMAVINSEATAGANLRMTIDSRIQQAAGHALEGARIGSVVVMDVHSGDIVAMESRPSYDPNSFIPTLSYDRWQALVHDPQNPLLDRVYRQPNPPGSTFKIITTLASMRANIFDATRTIDCPGYFDVGNMRYQLPLEKGTVSFRAALARSFNTYFFDLGLRTGRDTLIATARDFGLGEPTQFILPGESKGIVPDDTFIRLAHKRPMGPGDLTNISVGQGDVLATPIQMADAMAAIANGGTLFRPRLAMRLENASGQLLKAFPSEYIRKVALPPSVGTLIDGMVAVTEEGTGKTAQIPGMHVAAKTGTAQVGSKTQPRQIAWMVGFLPAENPKYSFAVMIEGGFDQDLHGGKDAGSVVGKLFGEVYAGTAGKDAQIKTE